MRQNVNLAAIINREVDSGVAHGRQLFDFASAVLGTDRAALDNARRELGAAMGPAAVVAAAIVAADFSLVDRAANAIGIGLESQVLEPSADFRAQLGINDYPSARNSLG